MLDTCARSDVRCQQRAPGLKDFDGKRERVSERNLPLEVYLWGTLPSTKRFLGTAHRGRSKELFPKTMHRMILPSLTGSHQRNLLK